MVTNNETQFITHKVSSIEHPQANGQAKAANKAKHLASILWAYHYSHQSTIGETPYWLTYETDAMILIEIGELSPRRNSVDPSENPSSLRVDLDLVEEAREQACIQQEACRQRATC
ncbi:hypothetical protein CR513_05839, partial [Mucuna pruriens]